jgi:dTDP-4-amino-4,6-dideoxygalactose transaminase
VKLAEEQLQLQTSTETVPRRVAVPLLDLKSQYRELEREMTAAIADVCARQEFILGRRVKELEERIAAYSQCQSGIGVSSGTDALLVALMALGIRRGDEVITTAYSFFATAGVVARLGARPLFCDVDPETYNLSPQSVVEAIETRCIRRHGVLVNRSTGGVIKALMPVHLFGQMADMDPLMEIAHRHGLKVIEDAAQAIGAEDARGRRAGSIGDIGCFSFFPSKNLGAFGDGGMCTTSSPALAERLKVLRVHGAKPKYDHGVIGGNFRLDELQAAVLLVKLQYLDRWTAARQANAAYYDAALAGGPASDYVSRPAPREGSRHVFNQYVLRTVNRDALRAHLAAEEIRTEIYYPIPLHMQRCFSDLWYRPEDCREAARAAEETLALPIYPELTPQQKEAVVDTIHEFYSA